MSHRHAVRRARCVRLLSAAAAIAVVMTACGDDDDGATGTVETTTEATADTSAGDTVEEPAATSSPETTPPPSSDPASTSAPASDEGTRVVDTPQGEVEVPATPQRVLALDPFATLQTLDELGAPLVAAGSLAGGERRFVSDEAAALPSVGVGTELNYEAIAAARPDLIIGLETYGDRFDLLSEIAPTVLVPVGDWRDVYTAVAGAAGLADDAEAALAGVDDRIAALAPELSTDGEPLSVSVVRVPPEGDVRLYTTYRRNIVSSALLAELGVHMTGDPLDPTEDESYVAIGAERLDDIDADVIVYYGGGGTMGDDQAVDAMLSSPLWSTLSAVQNGHAHEVDGDVWFSGANARAVELILDDVEAYLVTAA